MSTRPTSTSPLRYFAVVPAAGAGSRVGGAVPKQFLPLAGKSVLEWTVGTLLAADWIEQVLVVLAPGDGGARGVLEGALGENPRLRLAAVGGATRRDTVLAALDLLEASAHDFVLVHDAARPGLGVRALERLRAEVGAHASGGLLAVAVDDTVKSANDRNEVSATVSRAGLWLAQTPQMFRCAPLRDALARHPEVTDEAGAMEAEGHAVRLVRGERANFKITTAEDLEMMDALLRNRESQ